MGPYMTTVLYTAQVKSTKSESSHEINQVGATVAVGTVAVGNRTTYRAPYEATNSSIWTADLLLVSVSKDRAMGWTQNKLIMYW